MYLDLIFIINPIRTVVIKNLHREIGKKFVVEVEVTTNSLSLQLKYTFCNLYKSHVKNCY